MIPVTFLTKESCARLKGYEGMSSMNSSFAFRTYEKTALLFFHAFSSSGHVAVRNLTQSIQKNYKIVLSL